MQRRAVFRVKGAVLIIAGAGSGKTTVLCNRIANMMRFGNAYLDESVRGLTPEQEQFLQDFPAMEKTPENAERLAEIVAVEPVQPWNILAITFTNKAAGELRQRLIDMIGEDAEKINASTFHSACVKILRREIENLGYQRSFTIYDDDDSKRIIKDAMKKLNLDEKVFNPKAFKNMISRCKDKMISPEEYAPMANASGELMEKRCAEVYTEYQSALRSASAVDFDDIIYLTVKLFEDFPDVLSHYQHLYKYIMVDEYQDTNYAQYIIVRRLSQHHGKVCVVGDDDQSIYKFRGATIENILSFEKQFKGARVIRLEQNYRSTQAILNAANAVISHNRGRKGKKLWTQNAAGDRITVYEAASESDEANYISSRIISMSKGKNFKDFAVLYRTNAQSNAVENAFKRSGIPYRIIGGTRFFDRAEVKDMLAYLCVINNRADDLRLARIINNPPRGIGAKTLEMADRLADLCKSHRPEDSAPGQFPFLRDLYRFIRDLLF